ncbi:MAG: (Fe-S)-binding protein [Gammaproteobacteria bacterium WSBS_2016_MAG_OTU1]
MKTGIFITCLADAMRPQIGFAAVRLLREAGVEPFYPPAQTCCGQVAFNSGYFDEAAELGEKCADLFIDCDKVVFPSASCCSLFRTHWQEYFNEDNKKMAAFADKCMELSEFLHSVSYSPRPQKYLQATYHDCCAGLRELNIKNTPRDFLKQAGVDIVEMRDCEECCGFGGVFSTKFSGISAAMADRKCKNIAATGTNTVLLGDLGCLLHLQGRMQRTNGDNIRFMHWAEVLVAEESSTP